MLASDNETKGLEFKQFFSRAMDKLIDDVADDNKLDKMCIYFMNRLKGSTKFLTQARIHVNKSKALRTSELAR